MRTAGSCLPRAEESIRCSAAVLLACAVRQLCVRAYLDSRQPARPQLQGLAQRDVQQTAHRALRRRCRSFSCCGVPPRFRVRRRAAPDATSTGRRPATRAAAAVTAASGSRSQPFTVVPRCVPTHAVASGAARRCQPRWTPESRRRGPSVLLRSVRCGQRPGMLSARLGGRPWGRTSSRPDV